MDIARITFLVRWEVILFVAGVAVTIAIKLLVGEINTRYLLYGLRRDGTRYFSPERVQMLVATIAIALQYFTLAQHTPSGQMPRLPDGSLELLGLSNAVYLGGKGFTAFRKITSAINDKNEK